MESFLTHYKVRLAVATIIVLLSFVYFKVFKNFNEVYAYLSYLGLLGGTIVTAFVSKRRDIVLGILYGLILLLFGLLFVFTFMQSFL